jgi:hypothetical protein
MRKTKRAKWWTGLVAGPYRALRKCGHAVATELKARPRRYCVLLLAATVLLSLYLVVSRAAEAPQTLMTLSAKTEIMTVTVDAAAAMILPVDNGKVIALNPPPGSAVEQCRAGFFTPAKYAELTIRRLQNGPLSIQIEPNSQGIAGSFIDNSHDKAITTTYRGTVTIVLDRQQKDCTGPSDVRLPIGGAAVLGADSGPQSQLTDGRATLLSAQLNIFGRASPPAWIRAFLPDFETSLYPAGPTLDIPAGSRLRECDGQTSWWWGFADAHMDGTRPEDRALSVALSTNANRLALSTAGGAKAQDRPSSACGGGGAGNADDVIAVSMFTRLFADPYAAILWLGVGTVLIVLQLLFSIFAIPPAE